MQADRFSQIFGSAPLPVALVDPSDYVLAANRALAEVLRQQTHQLVGERLFADRRFRVIRWPIDGGEQLVLMQRIDADDWLWQASAIAHHLRNPLSGVSGALHILRDRLQLSSSERDILEEILDRLAALNQSVDALVDFSQPIEPQRRMVSLMQLVRDSAARLADSGQHSVAVDIGPDGQDATTLADPVLLKRAILHLLVNAAEAAGNHSSVTISVQASDGWCHLEVTDRGPGWSDEAQRRMGEPFFTTKSQHLGVGLAMARRIAAAHDGNITLRRTDQTGSTVSLDLPITDAIDPTPG